jgi:hypothetical protein
MTLEAQERIFRLTVRDHAASLNAISIDSNIPYNTIRSYAAGQSVMPLPAFIKLCGVIPDYLLSQLLAPVDRQIVPTPTDIDFDQLGADCMSYAAELQQARHPNSPGGSAIVESEVVSLTAKAPKAAG